MSARAPRNIRRLVVTASSAALVVAGMATTQGNAGAAVRTASPAAASAGVVGHSTQTGTVRHITKRGSSKAFPSKGRTFSTAAAMNIAENHTLQRYALRSNSPRPTVVDKAGARALAAEANPATSWVPRVSPTSVSTSQPRLATSWNGLSEVTNERTSGFSFEPPDQGLCVGAGKVLELINVSARVYRTDSTPAAPAVSLNRFFHYPPLFDPTTEKWGPELTDPYCTYDAGSKRFFATVLTLELDPESGNLTLFNHIDIAVSKTSNPLGGWNFYTIQTTDTGGANGPAHADCPCIGDYPHHGLDANGLYITTNEYPWGSGPGEFGNNFNGAQVYAISKQALTSGETRLAVVQFENTHVNNPDRVRVGFAIKPAQSTGRMYATEDNGSEYMTSSFAAEEARPNDFTGHASQIGLWQVANTASLNSDSPAPVLNGYVLGSEPYGVPPASEQKPGPTPLLDCLRVMCRGDGSPYTSDVEGGLDSSDSRMLTTWYVNGRVLTALDTVMIVSGNVQAGVAWFALNARGSASTRANQGYLGVTDHNVIYPAIATAPSGRGVMGFTLTGTAFYPSAAYAFFNAQAGAGTVHVASRGRGPEDGFCEYTFYNCGGTDPPTPRPRWGDYGAATWDGHHLWVANEYIRQRCDFATFDEDVTCGGTRTYYGNFSTRITALDPAS